MHRQRKAGVLPQLRRADRRSARRAHFPCGRSRPASGRPRRRCCPKACSARRRRGWRTARSARGGADRSGTPTIARRLLEGADLLDRALAQVAGIRLDCRCCAAAPSSCSSGAAAAISGLTPIATASVALADARRRGRLDDRCCGSRRPGNRRSRRSARTGGGGGRRRRPGRPDDGPVAIVRLGEGIVAHARAPLAADRPEFEPEIGEIARDMDREAAGGSASAANAGWCGRARNTCAPA